MPSTQFADAYVKYLTLFPSKESLGEDDPPTTWKAELDRVSPGAFDQIRATQLTLEGGSLAGVSNFAQMHLVRALYAVRAKRDTDFVNPYTDEEVPEPMRGKRMGSIVRLGTW